MKPTHRVTKERAGNAFSRMPLKCTGSTFSRKTKWCEIDIHGSVTVSWFWSLTSCSLLGFRLSVFWFCQNKICSPCPGHHECGRLVMQFVVLQKLRADMLLDILSCTDCNNSSFFFMQGCPCARAKWTSAPRLRNHGHLVHSKRGMAGKISTKC